MTVPVEIRGTPDAETYAALQTEHDAMVHRAAAYEKIGGVLFYVGIPCFAIGVIGTLVEIGDLTIPIFGPALLVASVIILALGRFFAHLVLGTATRRFALTDEMIEIGKKNGVYDR